MNHSSPNSDTVDLSQEIVDGMFTTPAHGVGHVSITQHAMCAATDISLTRVEMSAHMGTHVDAPRHMFPQGPTIDEYDVEVFEGPGIVLDVAREGIAAVTREDIESASIRRDDFVLFCFDYGKWFMQEEYLNHPYLTTDAADLLVERGVRMVGVDTITPDMPAPVRPPDFHFPVHRRLLGSGILIIENLGPALTELRGARIHLSAVPLAIRGGDAGPARVIARRVG